MVRRVALVTVAVVAALGLLPGAAPARTSNTVRASWFGQTPPLGPGQIELAVISSLPSTVTGEDTRVAVRGVQPGDVVRLDRNGTDVPSVLHDGTGVVAGLRVGANRLIA